MAHLCALKRTSEFTDIQVLTWYAGLATFPAWIINRAVLRVGTSKDRFTEFGDVYQICRREALQAGLLKEPYARAGNDAQIVSQLEILTMGQAMGLPVSP
jgi:hypothetical protein